MRAILLENDDDIAALFPCICARAGITLKTVVSKDGLFYELQFLHPGDFLLIDCTHEYPHVINVVNGLALQESIDVYIIAPQAGLVERMETQTDHRLHWLPADLGLRSLLMEFRSRLACSIQEHTEQTYTALLSQQERHVVFYVIQEMTNLQIAALLNIREGTVKTYISRICRKCHLPDRKAIARFFQHELATLSISPRHAERTKLTCERTYK